MDGDQPAGPAPAYPGPVMPAPCGPEPGEGVAPVESAAPGEGAGAVQADEPPVVVPEPPSTGDAGVDEAVQLVAEAVHGSLEDQVLAYETAHKTLQDRLADVES